MTPPVQPRLRRVESFPVSQADGQVTFALRDPEGFARPIVVPYTAAVVASLMDGTRTLAEVQDASCRQFGQRVELSDVEQLARDLDERWFLDTDRFRARWKAEIERYLNSPIRPAAHAGAAYAAAPEALRRQLSAFFTCPQGPGAPRPLDESAAANGLCGIVSPHVDLRRGGPAFAWAYKRLIEETTADVFVVFGTAHNPMSQLFSLTRKNFETPLGTVATDRTFISKLTARFAATPTGRDLNLFANELAHRQEHSIEFQVVFLQYLLGEQRPFTIVPVLVGSFQEFVSSRTLPQGSPEVAAFTGAMRETAAERAGRVFYVSGSDLAHIGQRFGDRAFLNAARLKEQAQDDRELLAAACRADAGAFFRHVEGNQDRHRICGLSPTYTMLEVMRPDRGELLKYDQAVELDGTSCVSFASLAFYKD